ncbi:sulfonate transport system permease protein [Bradyrhizobium sp. AZCC 2262]|uniref:ABC transporter permease n=1 Tax=Bradyrhizobium sp. AZCC 2262 TaxID=3117022 RepID=UPI002FEF6DCD
MSVVESRIVEAEAARAVQLGADRSVHLVDLGANGKPASSRSWIPVGRGALRTLVPIGLLVTWQTASVSGLVEPTVLPPPLMVIGAFGELIGTGELQAAIPASLHRALTGLALGASTGLVLGLFAGLWRLGEELFDAPLQMLRTIPFIAMIPLFIIWFGIGETAKVALIYGATIFPVYLNTYAGVRGVDPKLIEAAKVFGLNPRQISLRVILPTALPSILVGIRFSAGVSLLALVAAEQINARSGIGYILNNANQNQRTDVIIAGIIVYALLGIVIDLAVRWVERLALPWRTSIVFT